MRNTTDPHARAQFITGLRDLADHLDAHPGIPVPIYGAEILIHANKGTDADERADIDHIAELLDAPVTSNGHYVTGRDFGPVRYRAVHIPTAWNAEYKARHSYEDTYLCCPECGNTDFIEIPATTHRGREYVLHCANDDCTWTVLP